MAIAKTPIDGSIFGVPQPPSMDYYGGGTQQSPTATGSFGDVAPLGGTPTVPPTAQAMAPSALIAQPQTMAAGDYYDPYAGYDPYGQPQQVPPPVESTPLPPLDTSLSFDPSQASDTTGINGGGGYPNLPGTTPSATAPAPTNNPAAYGNAASFGQAWLASGGKTNADLAAFVKAHPEYGATIGGSKGNKIYGPNGQYWAQATQSGGLGGVAGEWVTDTGGGSGSGGGGDLSSLINQALSGALMNGSTPFGNQMQQVLMNIISGHGMTPNLNNQLQTARTDSARAMNAQLSDADAALASRGMASTPGVAQGPNIGATERVAESVGADYAATVRDIEAHGLDLANANEIQALSLATGLSESQAQNILSAIGLGTNRQSALASIALQQLSMSQDWNKFILGYGLDQQRLAEDISQGRIGNVIQLLQLYLQGAGTAGGGYY